MGAVENGAALGTWFAHGAVSHADLPQLELHLHDAVAEHGVDRIIIANVAGNALRVQLEYVLQRTFPAMLLPEQTISWFASVAEEFNARCSVIGAFIAVARILAFWRARRGSLVAVGCGGIGEAGSGWFRVWWLGLV